jgi:hypothetical protein
VRKRVTVSAVILLRGGIAGGIREKETTWTGERTRAFFQRKSGLLFKEKVVAGSPARKCNANVAYRQGFARYRCQNAVSEGKRLAYRSEGRYESMIPSNAAHDF